MYIATLIAPRGTLQPAHVDSLRNAWGGGDAQWLHAGSTLFAIKLQTPAPGRMKGPASLAELLEGTDAGKARVPHEPEGVPPALLEPPDPGGRTFAPIALDWQ